MRRRKGLREGLGRVSGEGRGAHLIDALGLCLLNAFKGYEQVVPRPMVDYAGILLAVTVIVLRMGPGHLWGQSGQDQSIHWMPGLVHTPAHTHTHTHRSPDDDITSAGTSPYLQEGVVDRHADKMDDNRVGVPLQ